jgi:hypothetical protein
MRGYTQFLSSDRLAGRATGTEGADLAAQYIASMCTGLGLKPLAGSYLHPVELEEATIRRGGSELTVSGPTGATTLTTPDGFLVNAGWGPPADFSGPAVYAPTSRDALAPGAPELNGSVVVLDEMSHPADDDSLRARGAVGMVHLSTETVHYITYVRSRGESRVRLADSTIERSLRRHCRRWSPASPCPTGCEARCTGSGWPRSAIRSACG